MPITNNRSTKMQVFTTFEVAKICGVFHTTVINWVNKKKLKASTTPGGHRRIAIEDLLSFMRTYEMQIPRDLITRGKRALIVEDDSTMRALITRCLEQLPGLRIDTCVGGLEALIEIGKEPPELLVLDIRIPQVNGLEVLKVLRAGESTRPIKIIAVTGEELDDADLKFLAKNADGFLRKPISTDEFVQLAAQCLELDSAKEER